MKVGQAVSSVLTALAKRSAFGHGRGSPGLRCCRREAKTSIARSDHKRYQVVLNDFFVPDQRP
jgi:hypothetical protein